MNSRQPNGLMSHVACDENFRTAKMLQSPTVEISAKASVPKRLGPSLCYELVERILMKVGEEAILNCALVCRRFALVLPSNGSRSWLQVARQFAFPVVFLENTEQAEAFLLCLVDNRRFARKFSKFEWPLIQSTRHLDLKPEIGDIFLNILQKLPALSKVVMQQHRPTLVELQALPKTLETLSIYGGMDIDEKDDPSVICFPKLRILSMSSDSKYDLVFMSESLAKSLNPDALSSLGIAYRGHSEFHRRDETRLLEALCEVIERSSQSLRHCKLGFFSFHSINVISLNGIASALANVIRLSDEAGKMRWVGPAVPWLCRSILVWDKRTFTAQGSSDAFVFGNDCLGCNGRR